ncbi:MAG TPA: NADH-quinone oxidoreductase subunit J [Rhizomicrobium sp.]|nr:NADH-quinone oxidoreductase subunit J [Rhizomicrobium sp.]
MDTRLLGGRVKPGHDGGVEMILTAIAFYLFSAVLIISALMVVASRNPVHSVLFLILAFFNAAGLFVLLGAEFLAMILVVVYVGAVAVLFLFVVMMLDIDFAELKRGAQDYFLLGAGVGLLLLLELIGIAVIWHFAPASHSALVSATPAHMTNTEALGHILYTDYVYYFEIAGLVLLVAMIGAIVLTLRHRPGVRRQSIRAQNARDPAEAMHLVDVKPGQGV